MAIKFTDLGLLDIIFTTVDEDTNVVTELAVSRLAADRKVRMLRTIEIPVEKEWAEYCLKNRGVEEHRVLRLMKVEGNFDHLLHIHWGDGSKLQVEGVHRYVASYLLGRKTIKTKVVPLTVWRPYIITGAPQVKDPTTIKDSFSGIL